jgi:cytochrome c-type biogenesis protein
VRTIVRASFVVAVLGLFLHRAAPAAAQAPAAARQVLHSHADMDHGAAHAAPSDQPTDYLTLNVAISDAELQPSAVFVPAGRPVRLMLRNRGSTEHHYRVVELVPDDLFWVLRGAPAPLDAVVDDEHNHHGRQFVGSRATSPAGIRPAGDEVHAYVSVPGDVDEVLFTANQTGTFVVQCDLHREQLGTLTVFDGAGPPPGAPVSPRQRQALALALSRDLGSVDYPGAPGVRVEATYATAEYVIQALGGAAAMAALQPDRHVAVLLTERTHTNSLPEHAPPPELYVGGSRVALIDSKVMTDSVHHRATFYRFARDGRFGMGHQVMTLRLASGQEATWHLPLVVPDMGAGAGPVGLGEQWGLILALLGGMLAAMWPCLFQLTVYFIPALAGIAMQEAGFSSKRGRRRQVLTAAFYFILGFTLLYTATGALIGFAAQRLGDTGQFEIWQRYFGIAAGVVVIALAVRVAAKVRAPLVCRMPVLSRMAHSNEPATRVEMMVAGLAFATGCMTCFGSALVVGMVVYVGLAQSAFYGALVLFLFSLGMGIPLVIAAVAMARALPLLMKLEKAVPWMGLASAILMGGFGTLLISGNYMVVSEWTYRLVSGPASLPSVGNGLVLATAVAGTLGFVGWLVWMVTNGRVRRSTRMGLRTP